MKQFRSVSIVIPARNEESTLGQVLSDLQKVIRELPQYDFETVVVNDHSEDQTAAVAQAASARVIENHGPSGKGQALITGFQASRGEIIIMLDADYSHRPEDIPVFLSLLEQGFGLVVGSRATGGSEEYTLVRTFGNIFLTLCFWIVVGYKVTDALNGFKAFRRVIFTDHHYRSKDFEIEIELLINTLRSGHKIGEFPCHERVRAGGKMKSRVLKHGIRFFWKILTDGLQYRLTKR